MKMAAQELKQIKEMLEILQNTVNTMRMVQDSLVSRVQKLEDGQGKIASGAPIVDYVEKKMKEEILTCVQCMEKYRESENAPGSCAFHPERVTSAGYRMKFPCCNKESNSYDSAMTIPGCESTGHVHKDKHHKEYVYHLYYDWIAKTRNNNIKEEWVTLERPDFEDNLVKKIAIGVTKNEELYVIHFVGRPETLALYKPEEVQKMVSEGKDIVLLEDSKGEYILKTEFVGGVIQLTAKSTNDNAPEEVKIEFGVNPLTKKNVVLPQAATLLDGFNGDTIPELPNVEITGPVISNDEPPKVEEHECEGDSVLKIRPNGKPRLNQSFASKGGFTQHVTSDVTVINGQEKEFSVTKTTSEYKDKDGKWNECVKTMVGYAHQGRRGKQYDFIEDGTSFNLDVNQTIEICVNAQFRVENAKPGNDNQSRQRLPKSLPQPLLLRYTFEDIDGKKVSIVTESVSVPLQLPSRERETKSWKVDVLKWVQCDDTEKENRLYFAVYFEKGQMVVRKESRYWRLDEDDIQKWSYDAKKEKTAVFGPIFEDKQQSYYALCDPVHNYSVYALKFVLKTSTSAVTDYYTLPFDLFKKTE